MAYHEPVLLDESIEGLNLCEDGVYVDVTFGGGGHSREILRKIKTGKVIAFDKDSDAIENKINNKNFQLVELDNIYRYCWVSSYVLADVLGLGILF